jgi:hypothetical protein
MLELPGVGRGPKTNEQSRITITVEVGRAEPGRFYFRPPSV